MREMSEAGAETGEVLKMVPRAPAELADDGLPSTGLLSFYDRLREGIIRTVERRGGKLGQRATDALLLVPDIFMLLVRLSLDKDVPKATRGVLASTLAYFVLPFDLLPEGVIGPVGYLDDLALALMALSQAFGRDLEVYAERHWSGSQSLRQVMSDALTTAHSLLGSSLFDRLQSVLAKRGVELEEPLQDG